MYYNGNPPCGHLYVKEEYNVSQNWYGNMSERILTFDIIYVHTSDIFLLSYSNICISLEYEISTNFTNIDMNQHGHWRTLTWTNMNIDIEIVCIWLEMDFNVDTFGTFGAIILRRTFALICTILHLTVCQRGRCRRDSYIVCDKLPCQVQTDNSCSTPPGWSWHDLLEDSV